MMRVTGCECDVQSKVDGKKSRLLTYKAAAGILMHNDEDVAMNKIYSLV